MPLTNNNVAGIDLPVWEILQAAPVASSAGVTYAGDNSRYLYALFSLAMFWRYDTWANTWQQLASPPSGTVGAGTCLQYDASRGSVWALISNGAATPTWQEYSPTTNAWTAKSVTNLPATFGTDAALAHPDTTVNAGAPSDDFIYLIGNASTVLYRYQISTNAWIATLTAQPSANGAGCELIWLPGLGAGVNNRLLRMRGANTVTFDYYDIGLNTWTNLPIKPDTETFSTGSYACKYNSKAGNVLVQKDATMKLYRIDFSSGTAGTVTPVATQFLLTNGAALDGNRMDTFMFNGIEFAYLGLHTSANLLRTPLLF